MFKSLANAPAHEADFKIINPVTFLPDEALKAFVIQRYRESPAESSETMVTVAASGDGIAHEVLEGSMLNPHHEEPGELSETMAADLSAQTTMPDLCSVNGIDFMVKNYHQFEQRMINLP
nr:hypothetical protein [Tanacetum cinerariifolium]